MKRLFICQGLLVLTLLQACQKDNLVEERNAAAIEQSKVLSRSQRAQTDYHYKHMTALAKGILYQSTNPAFRSLLYQKVGEQFDGEANVLLEKLAEAYGSTRFYHEMNQSLRQHGDEDDFENSLRAFDYRDVNGKKLFPQIYIPFFEAEPSEGIVLRQYNSEDEVPVIIIENPTEETEAEPGYTLDDKGNFVQTDELITEEYAKEHEVWVVSLNERVDSQGALKMNPDAVTNLVPGEVPPVRPPRGCNDGVVNGNPSDDGLSIWVKTLDINSHKESWYRGGSEIEIAMTSSEGTSGASNFWAQVVEGIEDPITGNTITVPSFRPQQDYYLKWYSRTNIGLYKFINVNITKTDWALPEPRRSGFYMAQVSWRTVLRNARVGNGGDVNDGRARNIVWVLFESDNIIDTRSATVSWDSGNRSAGVVYSSRDSEYLKGFFSLDFGNYPCNLSVRNNHLINFTVSRGSHSANFDYDND